MVAAEHWLPVARKVTKLIKRTHSQYNSTFSSIPAFSTTVRLLDEEQFYRLTGAPRWTNAMYYRGEITIPLSPSQLLDLDNLYRSIKHEYTHAVVHSLSGGKCPGWLDEGIAQWAEGAENPALEPALRDWLTLNPPVPLRYLQGGFTKLQTSMVAPAYAQSLFAARNMIKRQGFYRIRRYLDLLRTGKSKAKAFKASFQISEAQYEKQLGSKLRSWALHRH